MRVRSCTPEHPDLITDGSCGVCWMYLTNPKLGGGLRRAVMTGAITQEAPKVFIPSETPTILTDEERRNLPGQRLKEVLSTLGFAACERCNLIAAQMDQWGVGGCIQRKTYLLNQLRMKYREQSWRTKWKGTWKALTTGTVWDLDLSKFRDPADMILSYVLEIPPETQNSSHSKTTIDITTLNWSYGVTTVPERRNTLLPKTLESLKKAGFDQPRLFVDGDDDVKGWKEQFNLPVTCRDRIYIHGNWFLSLHELYIREPHADRYIIFQDDLVTYHYLMRFLEATELPEDGYFNLYTHPHYAKLAGGVKGWHASDSRGLGALALMFTNKAVTTLLASPIMVDRPKHVGNKGNGENKGWRNVDGGIVTAMKYAGFKEYFHFPGLVQHTGLESTVSKAEKALPGTGTPFKWGHGGVSVGFKGENFNAMELL